MIRNPSPGGCRYCGVEKVKHCQIYHGPELGYGGFVAPTQEQIKERMLRRRRERRFATIVDNIYHESENEVNISMEHGLPNAD